jgi:hypothetical protein
MQSKLKIIINVEIQGLKSQPDSAGHLDLSNITRAIVQTPVQSRTIAVKTEYLNV